MRLHPSMPCWLAALVMACGIPHAHGQQFERHVPSTPAGMQAQPAGGTRDAPACTTLPGICNQRARVCEADRAQCESTQANLRADLDAAHAELALLRPQAALPVCSGRREWLHAVLPTVHCWPYACGDTPFACKRSCNEQNDCAPDRRCAADGRCLAPL